MFIHCSVVNGSIDFPLQRPEYSSVRSGAGACGQLRYVNRVQLVDKLLITILVPQGPHEGILCALTWLAISVLMCAQG